MYKQKHPERADLHQAAYFLTYCDLHPKLILQLIGMGLSNTVYWLSCIQGWTSVKGLLIEVADYKLWFWFENQGCWGRNQSCLPLSPLILIMIFGRSKVKVPLESKTLLKCNELFFGPSWKCNWNLFRTFYVNLLIVTQTNTLCLSHNFLGWDKYGLIL